MPRRIYPTGEGQGGEPEGRPHRDWTPPIEPDPAPTIPTRANSELDGTISALSGGITALNPATAVSNIEGWASRLQATGQPHLISIAKDLGALRTLLTNGSLG